MYIIKKGFTIIHEKNGKGIKYFSLSFIRFCFEYGRAITWRRLETDIFRSRKWPHSNSKANSLSQVVENNEAVLCNFWKIIIIINCLRKKDLLVPRCDNEKHHINHFFLSYTKRFILLKVGKNCKKFNLNY